MKANMGTADKAIRIVIAASIATLWFAKIISGISAVVLLVLSAVFLLTSFVSFCPLYVPFKFSTKKQ